MVRVPIGNERSARIEVRAVAPDANPYLVMHSVFKTGIDGEIAKIENLRQAHRYLPDNIYSASICSAPRSGSARCWAMT